MNNSKNILWVNPKILKLRKKRGLYGKLFFPFLNVIGFLKGNGGCLNCGDTYNWKRFYKMASEIGAFPLCDECYNKLSVKDIHLNLEKLGLIWLAQSLDKLKVNNEIDDLHNKLDQVKNIPKEQWFMKNK